MSGGLAMGMPRIYVPIGTKVSLLPGGINFYGEKPSLFIAPSPARCKYCSRHWRTDSRGLCICCGSSEDE